jgi:hypothetical protein
MNQVLQPSWLQNYTPGPSTKFQKGETGNPKGRPKGIKDKRDKLLDTMLSGAGEVLDAVLERAKEGDPASASLVLGRVLPALRAQSQTVEFHFDPELPIGRQIEQVLAAVARGEVPPDTGQSIIAMIGTLSNVRATEELEERIKMLEAKDVTR